MFYVIHTHTDTTLLAYHLLHTQQTRRDGVVSEPDTTHIRDDFDDWWWFDDDHQILWWFVCITHQHTHTHTELNHSKMQSWKCVHTHTQHKSFLVYLLKWLLSDQKKRRLFFIRGALYIYIIYPTGNTTTAVDYLFLAHSHTNNNDATTRQKWNQFRWIGCRATRWMAE